jgi:hypothetical protein
MVLGSVVIFTREDGALIRFSGFRTLPLCEDFIIGDSHTLSRDEHLVTSCHGPIGPDSLIKIRPLGPSGLTGRNRSRGSH